MRIGVASAAIETFPVINDCWLGLKFSGFLVALAAGSRDMPSGQHESGFLVFSKAKCRRFISFQGMAAITGVEVRSRRKLPGVSVSMAICTVLKFNLEKSVLPFGEMTSSAL